MISLHWITFFGAVKQSSVSLTLSVLSSGAFITSLLEPIFYKRKIIKGLVDSEIILSKPILSKLSNSEINSTLCHEMIHAWVDRILKKNEIHGPNFLEKMNEINEKEKNFQISVRHSFPIERRELKYIGTCQNCGEKFFYRKRIKNIACKKCCVNFFNGSWNKKCLILFD